MKLSSSGAIVLLLSATVFSADSQIFTLDNLTEINGYAVSATGSPQVKSDSGITYIQFNPGITEDPESGTGDRLQIRGNPLRGATEFTIEALVRLQPDSSTTLQPRILHIAHPDSASNAKRTLTLEARYSAADTWYADYFVRSVSGSGLMNASLTHGTGEWIHFAMTYGNGTLTGYINGVKEAETTGTFTGLPDSAEISIGGRMQGRYYFKGDIQKVAFTPGALTPETFVLNPSTQAVKAAASTQKRVFSISGGGVLLSLNAPEDIKVSLYDSRGRLRYNLYQGRMAAGNHFIPFRAGTFSSGIYFCEIKSAAGKPLRKLVQIK